MGYQTTVQFIAWIQLLIFSEEIEGWKYIEKDEENNRAVLEVDTYEHGKVIVTFECKLAAGGRDE